MYMPPKSDPDSVGINPSNVIPANMNIVMVMIDFFFSPSKFNSRTSSINMVNSTTIS
jgi:hypothetical protein